MDKSLPSISATPAANSQSKKRSAIVRPRPLPLALEARLMFDGAAVAATVETMAAEPPSDTTQASDIVVPEALPTQPTRNEIAFVDTSVSNWSAMVASLGNTVEVVALDGTTDGLSQIANSLQGRSGLDAIHIISHGSAGNLQLSGVDYTAESIGRSYSRLQEIGQALAANGDILLYGCDIGQGSAGQALLDAIASITAADVAASGDATGAASAGGDWQLEAASGTVEAAALSFSDDVTPGLLGTPSVTSVDDRSYTEGQGAVIVDSNITVTGGGSYDGKYVRFSLTNGQTTDVLTLTNAANVNASGAISFSGTSVYLGNGSGRDIIGSIDATEDGTAGKALKINFVSSFTNASFESGNLTGWTALNQVINLGTTSIAGYTSPNDGTYPANAGNDDAYPSTKGSYTTTVNSTQATDGSKSLRLLSENITTASGYDVVHGPAVYSDAFSAVAGDKIYFDWRAYAGDDAYDVFGYILNTATGATTTVLDATGNSSDGSTSWATANVTIPTTGSYRFVFVSGTYDYSGGQAAGASLYIDNVRVYGSKVNDAVVTSIARQVAFNATSDNPVTASTRIFTVTAMSSDGATGSDTGLITVSATNDAPVLGGAVQTISYTENGVAKVIDAAITVADPDQPANLNNGWLQVQITANGASEDQLSIINQGTGAGQIGVSGSNVTYGGTIIGTIDASNTGANGAALRINLNSSATTIAVQALARQIAYQNPSDTPSTSARTVTFTLNDGGNTGSGGALQGTRTATINVTAVDDPSVLTLSAASKTYDENDNSYFVDASLTLTDVDSATINGARVVISGNFRSAEDRLSPASGTDVTSKITYSFNTTTGILTLTGTATIAEYEAALRAVKYENLSNNPDTATRSISITIGNAVALTINGTTHYYEYVSGSYTWAQAKTAAEARTFQGLTGYLATITSQTENDFIKEKLQADAWIGASDDYTYINAATGTTTFANQTASEGKWYWVTGPEKGTLISTGNGTPVTATNGYAYWNNLEPNNSGSEHYGEIYSSGGSAGRWNDLGASNNLPFVVEYSDNSSVSSFSKSINITPVRKNDAPVNNAPNAIPSITEDAISNSGSLISSFLSATDADGNALGVAVTAVDNSGGAWQYSTDGGATWLAFGTPTDSTARLLRSTDKVRFVPNADFAGTATIEYRAWDRTTGTVGSTADLSGPNSTGTYKAVTNGDETAYSATKRTATLTVTAVNDAPVLTPASPALTGITEDDTNDTSNAGQTIDSLLETPVRDVDASALEGIAITALTSGNGTWQYNTGSGWTNIGTVSASSALLLRATDSLRFVPDGKNATTGTVSFKAWDQTSGSAGSMVSTASSGGTTAFSTASDTASITVTSVNDAPVLGTPANLSGISEDASNNAGQTIASFLGSSLTDVDTGALQGIAITGASNGTATGTWEYSTGGGTYWYTVGSPTTSTALLLKASDRVRFNADGFKGGTPTLTLRGWDQSSGTASSGATRGTANVSTNGGTTAFSSDVKTVSLSVSELNDAPRFDTPASNSSFTENSGTPATVGADLVLVDDGGNLSKATVSISAGFTAGDTLAAIVGTHTGITSSYNSATGVLTLSGTASAATYQAALQSVTFTTASEDPTVNSATRTLTWKATDTSGLVSNASTSRLTITPLADAPVLAGTAALAYTEDDGARVLAPLLTLSDVDDTQMAGAVVLLTGTGLDKAVEYLSLRGAVPALNGGAYEWSATDVMGYTGVNATYVWDSANSRGVLTIKGLASTAAYQQILRSVSYTSLVNDESDPDAFQTIGTRSVSWRVIDANSDAAGSDPVATFLGSGTGNGTLSTPLTLSQTITITNANEEPQVSGANISLPYSEVDTIKILANAIVPSDDNSDNVLGSAQVQITAGLTEGDILAVGNDADAIDGYIHTVLSWPNWPSVTASRTTIGDGSKAEVQTLSNLDPFAVGQSFTLLADNVKLSGTLTGSTLGDLVTALKADSDYATAPFTIDHDGNELVVTWKANGNVSSPAATLTSVSTVDLSWNSVAASRTTTGDGSNAEVQTLRNLPKFATSQSFTLVAGSVTLSGTLAGPTLDELVTVLQADVDYGGAPFTIARSGADLVITWKANGVVASPATLSSGSPLHETIIASYNTNGILSLSGNASIAAYQSVLRSVTYGNTTNDDPTATANTRAVQWRVFDANGTPSEVDANATTTIQVKAVNDKPTVAPSGTSATFSEGDNPVVAFAGLTLADPDDTLLTRATVEITGGGFTGDKLDLVASALTGTGLSLDAVNSTASKLILTGNASLATYQAVLRQVTFSSSSDNPANSGSNPSRTLSWTVTDDFASRLTDYPVDNDVDPTKATSLVVTSTITIAPANDAPVVSVPPGPAVSYTEGGSAVTLASGITLTDLDDANLTQAKVWISGGFTAGDTLSANAGSTGITVSYDSATGILTLSHAGASKADFESVLRTVTFSSTADDPTAVSPSRSISWQVTDADSSTGAANKLVSNLGTTQLDLTASDDGASISGLASAAFTENGSPVAIAPTATLADSDDTTLSGLTVTISTGLTSGDLLSVGANLTGTGITVTAFNGGTGKLVLSGTASLADYTKALNSIVFTSSSENPTATSSSRTFTWSTTSSFASRTSNADAGNNGASGTVTASAGSNTLTITATNDAPSLSLGYNTVLDGTAVVFQQGGSPIYVLLDSSNPNKIGSATLSDIDDSNMARASVVISGNRATDNKDTLSVATPAGWTLDVDTLRLTAPGGGTVTVAFDESTGTLTLTTVSKSVSQAEYEVLLENVQYQNSSLSPTASGASRELTWTVTDANAAGDGSATGKSYMVIRDKNDAPTIDLSTDTVTYTEGDSTVDLPDIVVTDVDPDEIVTAKLTLDKVAAGTLSVPTGASYNPATGVWTISGSVADVNTALAALTFTPATNNDQNTPISISVADGGEDKATAATGTINLNVTAVNDAPVLTASHPVLARLTEDETSNGGMQVSAFRGEISDVDSSFARGIAITAQDAGNGKWQYQIGGNSGSWTDFGTVSDASALVLADADYIRFVPNAENATTAGLTYRGWDGSGTVTAQRMDATASGGNTPFSTVSDEVSLVVTDVNDAPVLTAAGKTLNGITEDDIDNAGQTVSDLLGTVSDVDTGATGGVAIFGQDDGNGTWQFRIDGTNTWNDFGTVSSSSALLLSSADHIRFVPNGLNTTTANFSFRAWDQTSGTAGSKADASLTGGTTPFSTTSDTASLAVVDAVNDAPVLTPASPTLDTITEDENNNAGQTVASFLGSSISDVDNSALQGIAITDTTVGNGHWEYSIDANIWIAFPSISESTALLLRDTDRIRFVPDRMNGTTATLTYRAWDRTTVAGAGSRTDAGTNGGTTAFSALTDTATLTVTPVNDAPINDTLPTRIGAERANGTLRQIATAGSTAGVWRDVDIGDPATRITYQWQIADDASGNGLRDISGATASTYVISPDFVGKFLRLKVMGSDNDSTTNVYTGFTEITNIDPSATMALVDQKTTESVPITFTVPTAAFSDPDVSKGEDSFTYSAKLADGSPLPAWLTFDPLTLTFSGTPSGADVGVLAVSVFASDGGNFPASITFNLTVLSLPSNPQPASPLPPAELPPSNAAGIFLVPAPTIPSTTSGTVTEGGSGAASGSIGSPTLYAGTATSIDAGVGQPGGFNLGGGTGGFGLPSGSDSGAGGSPFAMPGMERNSGMAGSGGDSLPKGILTAPGDGAFRVVVTQSDQPSLMVYRGISEAAVQREGGTVQLQIPADAFTHTNPMAVITLSARLSDGAPLPAWLKFDQASGKLVGTPPADFSGVIEVEVTARDDDGREARVIFKIKGASRIQLGHPGLSEQIRLASRPASSFDLGKATGLAQRLREPTRITT